MKRLLIVGAGGFGREVWDWASAVPQAERDWEPFGFLDGNSGALDAFAQGSYGPIVGDPATYQIEENDCFVCAIGHSQTRLRLGRELRARGAQFITLRHPTSLVGTGSHIGIGSILCPGVVITCNATLGEFVILNAHSTVGHDAILGDGCTLSAHCDVTGFCQLGEGVLMGTHAAVIPSVKVGDYATIGAGSVAMRRVKAGTTVVGVPARALPSFNG